MTTITQPDTFRIPGQDQDYFAPSGTVQFLDDEQVDFRQSALTPVEKLTQAATELATPRHPVMPGETIDGNRVEFGGAVVETIERAAAIAPETVAYIDPAELAKIGAVLVALRIAQAMKRDV